MFTWTWFDGEDDEADRSWIQITDPDGEEFAVIMHRHTTHPDSEKWATDKEARAQMIVDALNRPQ